MRPKIALMSALALAGAMLALEVSAEETAVLESQTEKMSYAIGVDMGKNFRRSGVEIDSAALLKGLNAALTGGELLMTATDIRLILKEYYAEAMRGQTRELRLAEAENKKAGDEFLARNREQTDVVALPSGLQYRVLKAGRGGRATDKDAVECNFRGTLLDGTEFDSSYPTGRPATLKLAEVIPGLREALTMMQVGSKWQLFVPPELAYGARPAGQDIGPNSTLIFELELVDIK